MLDEMGPIEAGAIIDTSGVDADRKGRYLGMVQTGTSYNNLKTGIDHLKELGVTDYDIYSYNKVCMEKYLNEI